MNSNRMFMPGKIAGNPGNVNESANDTIFGIVAAVNKEGNDVSDQGENDQNPDWLDAADK